MKVAEGLGNGLEEYFGFRLLHAMLRLGEEIIIQRVGPSVLLDKIDLVGTFYDINQLGYHWVIKLSQYIDFALEVFKLIWLVEFLFVVDLNCYFLVRSFADPHLHHTVCPFAQLLIDLVVL